MPHQPKNQCIERKCRVCNADFIANRIDKIYCSPVCAKKAKNTHQGMTPEERERFLARQREHNRRFKERLDAQKERLQKEKQKPSADVEQAMSDVARVMQRYTLYTSNHSAWIKEY